MNRIRNSIIYSILAVVPFAAFCLVPLYLSGDKSQSPNVWIVTGALVGISSLACLLSISLHNFFLKEDIGPAPRDDSRMVKWLFLFVMAEIYFATSSFFPDITCTQNRGIDLYYSILSGNGFRLYTYESVFYIPVHIIIGLWSLPFVVLQLYGMEVQYSTIAVLWAKLLFVAVAVGCVWLYTKLLVIIGCKDQDFWIFALCASPLFFMPVFAWAFYDQIELLFGLWAILNTSKEDKLSFKTLLLLSIAVSIKALFFFPAFLLILIKEKRIKILLRDCIILGCIPAVFFCVFILGGLGNADPALDSLLPMVLLPKVLSGVMDMPLFFLVFFALCFLAFFHIQPCMGGELVLNTSWLACASYLALLILTNHAHPQWSILLIPFLLLLSSGGKRGEKEKLLLSVGCQLSLCITQFYVFSEGICLNDYNFQGLVLKTWEARSFRGLNIASFGNLVDYVGLGQYIAIMPAIALTSSLFLLLRNTTWITEKKTWSGPRDLWEKGKRDISALLLVYLYGCYIFTFLIAAIV